MHATNKRHAFDSAEVQRLYLDEGWTMARLAAHYGCGETTIKRRLEELGIASRRQGLRSVPEEAPLSNGRPRLPTRSEPSPQMVTCPVMAACLTRSNAITTSRAHGRNYYRLQWGDRLLYEWLVQIGLTPAKSLTLGPLNVPGGVFPDFLRGCIDGDGSIQVYTDRYLTNQSAKYVYQRLFVSLVSASPAFLEWIQAKAADLFGVKGALFRRTPRSNETAIWMLKHAKKESLLLLPSLYYKPDLPCLHRKHQIALPFLTHGDND